jgi:hypothetical protein
MPQPYFLVLAALLAPAAASPTPTPAPASPPSEVLGWLQPLAGRAATACDTLACAAEALRSARPFWIVLDTHATPGAWTGMVRNAEGKAWSVSFGPHSITVLSCGRLVAEPAGLRCVAA